MTADCWALEYDEVDSGRYAGVPVDTTEIISGAGFTPVISFTGGRHDGDGVTCGVQDVNGKISFFRYAHANYNVATDDVRRSGLDAARHYKVDHTFTFGVVTEDVATVGAPGAGASPYHSCLAFGVNSGAIRRGA